MTTIGRRLKTCTGCHAVRSLDDFYRNRGTKDGHSHRCKPCFKLQHVDGRVQRHDHWCATPDDLVDAAYLIPLRSFAAATDLPPADPSSDVPPPTPGLAGGTGRHRSAAVSATPSQ